MFYKIVNSIVEELPEGENYKDYYLIYDDYDLRLISNIDCFYKKALSKKIIYSYDEYQEIFSDGRREFKKLINGDFLYHRIDGPALEDPEYKIYYNKGVRHREDGPAVEHPDGLKRWFLDGREYSQKEYEKLQENGFRKQNFLQNVLKDIMVNETIHNIVEEDEDLKSQEVDVKEAIKEDLIENILCNTTRNK